MAMKPVRAGAASPSRPLAGVQPVYEDFRPMSEWQQDEESDILLLFLPGFLKQHLKVSIEGKNTVRVRGERLVAGNKWSRFQEDYPLPEKCNIRAIHARFEGGILTITMPRNKGISQAPQVGSNQEVAKATPPMQVPPSTDQTQQILRPPGSPVERRLSKGADDIHQKVSNPPSITNEKGQNDGRMFSQPQTQNGQDEEKDRPRSPKSRPVTTLRTSATDGVERKEIISNETKAKPAKSESIENVKEVTDDKKSTENSNKEAASNIVKEKSEKIMEKMEYKGQKQKQITSTTSVPTSSIDYRLPNDKKAVKSIAELNEERQLLLNIGAAVLVIVAFGTYITYKIRSGEA